MSLNVARVGVEIASLRLSLPGGDDDWEAGMAAAAWRVKKADRALREGRETLEGWERANAAFHAAAASACNSRRLLCVRALMQDQCARYRLASIGLHRTPRDPGAEDAAIADAVLARDVDAACRLTAEHYRRTAVGLSPENAVRGEDIPPARTSRPDAPARGRASAWNPSLGRNGDRDGPTTV
ncbi:FCD domain-containing protein [Lutibaculum baratangense]|uniref:FCD domain-containing protein n=1 Tax=Lutibaculum baratangense TaxID=1358440 RepID=UPI0009E05776|nr:FCD domain-containing protein [Lutibaculum baratangense]